MMPSVLILHATGSNRDREASVAAVRAGGRPSIAHVNQLLGREISVLDHAMLVIPGGFSFGDDLGAGSLLGALLRERLGGELAAFVASGRPVLGICNGFQVLVKSGLLPGPTAQADGAPAFAERTVSLARNASGQFECRWVWLAPESGSCCVFTRELTEPIYCPVAHGEGRFVVRDDATLAGLQSRGQVALRYVAADGGPADGFADNPNGSMGDIAGICNAAGNVLGLMPHPEDHIDALQSPNRAARVGNNFGLSLFAAGIRHAARC